MVFSLFRKRCTVRQMWDCARHESDDWYGPTNLKTCSNLFSSSIRSIRPFGQFCESLIVGMKKELLSMKIKGRTIFPARSAKVNVSKVCQRETNKVCQHEQYTRSYSKNIQIFYCSQSRL
ncbi:hypothetical protein YC2023_049915 [Brassica napus]